MTDLSVAAELKPALDSERDPVSGLKFHGYCGECGTWDAHGKRCSHCGYDFHEPGEAQE